ncbi:MAG: hypothetical protein HXM96_04255 [Parvimonas sp.]|uniref:hypothetical protein n=1 Tax=Parvimonas sp. TaxID=1944660 RepID=UPI001CB5F46A|nr:hypothetical protein [Parvimonas sp.]MBF1295300.1 hypothetical protein [Parvimonas sp.]
MRFNLFKKNKSEAELAKDSVQAAISKTNKKIEELGEMTKVLSGFLFDIQEIFDKIRKVPNEKRAQFEIQKNIILNWKEAVEKIDKDYQENNIKSVGTGALGAGFGIAVVTMGPTAAMGIATTFGVASTGTAISSLSGAAAMNAALAWIGGGTLATGGGGIATGTLFLSLLGPVGWSISGLAILTSLSLFFKGKNYKNNISNIFIKILERENKKYELATIEIKERINIIKDECKNLENAIDNIKTFGLDYNNMTESQQYKLGTYVNMMKYSTQLLTSPIKSLELKFSMEDFDSFLTWSNRKTDNNICKKYKNCIFLLSNRFYNIEIDNCNKKYILKWIRSDKKDLEELNITKKELKIDIINAVFEALDYKYMLEKNRKQ